MVGWYVVRRLIMAVPTLLGVIVFVFVLLRIVPGDPIAMMVVGETTPEDIARLRHLYGFDRSIVGQFMVYSRDVLTGNFGTSIMMKQNVLSLVLDRLPATLELAFVAMIIATVAGVFLGLISAYFRGRWIEAVVDFVNAVALAIPEFLWALLLVLAFGVMLPILPISGRIDPVIAVNFKTGFYLIESLLTGRFALAWSLFQYLILPAASLALPLMAVIARILKTSLLDAVNQDYVLLARLKGFSPSFVLTHHALPNALIPTVTITGVHFIFLVGSTVVVELIFSYPGIGNLLYQAAVNRDLPLIQGVTFVFAVLFILLNLLVDLSYAFINPRVSLS
jgi:ABC-type dipeptide/oligopeptide/nickel transport system permease component